MVTLRPPSPCWKSVYFETEKKHHGNHLGIMSASELRIFLSASGGGGDLELRTGELITFKVFADHPLGNVQQAVEHTDLQLPKEVRTWVGNCQGAGCPQKLEQL